MPDHVFVDPDTLAAAAAELDALAGRLQATVSAASPVLTVAPAGSEEVSVLAAGYFNRLASSVGPVSALAVRELTVAAAMLRAQAAAYRDEDRALGTSLDARL